MDGNQVKKFDPKTAKRFDPTSARLVEEQTQEKPPESFLGQVVGNILPSAKKFGEDIISPITNPVETAKGIGQLASAIGTSGVPNPAHPFAQQIGKFFVERYGSLDKALNTIKSDPVGFLSDLSTAFGGAGALAKAGNLSRVAKVASTASKVTDPIAMAGNVARQPFRLMPKAAPLRMYESALKPSTTLEGVERTKMAKTGLEEAIPITGKGLRKLQSNVDALNNQIQAVIVNSAAQGRMIDSRAIVQRLDKIKEFFGETVTPQKYIDEINKLEQDFLDAHGHMIDIDKAQRIKQNTYAVLRKSYGELSTAAKETQKNLARGIKEEIAIAHPELKALNERESSLLALEDAIDQAVNKQYNKELIPGSSIWTGAAGTMAGGPAVGTSAFIGRLVLENPVVKSKLAIALNKARSGRLKGGRLNPIVTGVRATREQQ